MFAFAFDCASIEVSIKYAAHFAAAAVAALTLPAVIPAVVVVAALNPIIKFCINLKASCIYLICYCGSAWLGLAWARLESALVARHCYSCNLLCC